MGAAILETQPTIPDRASRPVAPRLVEGTELLGQYESSAFAQPHYLLRRHDGQVIQITQLLYLVASSIDGLRDPDQIATKVTEDLGRPVSAANIDYLVEHKLHPLGVMATGPDTAVGQAPGLVRANPLLALRLRTRMVPARLHRGATWALRPLFWSPVVLAVLAAFAGTDIWLADTGQLSHLATDTAQLLLHPQLLLLVTALTAAGGAFHEVGHATAARYGGAKPGVMGVGIYLMMPVFYTDVTDSYRLNRRGRLRTDLGGIYFNLITIVIAAAVYAATGFTPLLVFMVVTQLEVLYQFLPFVRMDGYYVVSDLIGVANLFAFVGPVVAGLFRRQQPAGRARLALIKRPARIAIRAWVLLTVPLLAVNLGVLVLLIPRMLPTAWTSAGVQTRALVGAVGAGDMVVAASRLIQLVLLVVPIAGMVFLLVLVLRRAMPPLTRWSITQGGRLIRRAAHCVGHRLVPAGAAAGIALAGAVLAVIVLAQPLPLRQPHARAGHATAAAAQPGRSSAAPTPIPAATATSPAPAQPVAASPAPTPIPTATAASPAPAHPVAAPPAAAVRPAVVAATRPAVIPTPARPVVAATATPTRPVVVRTATPAPAVRTAPGRLVMSAANRTHRPAPTLSRHHVGQSPQSLRPPRTAVVPLRPLTPPTPPTRVTPGYWALSHQGARLGTHQAGGPSVARPSGVPLPVVAHPAVSHNVGHNVLTHPSYHLTHSVHRT